jgi:hypothetical protein
MLTSRRYKYLIVNKLVAIWEDGPNRELNLEQEVKGTIEVRDMWNWYAVGGIPSGIPAGLVWKGALTACIHIQPSSASIKRRLTRGQESL